MSGTISLSLTQQIDKDSLRPLSGGLLYFFEAGTSTPQNAFTDTGLTNAHPNPIILDAAGRVPQFFLADGTIKIRLANSDGVTQLAADDILVIGPSSGDGGGGSTVDTAKVFDTGDLKHRFGTGAITGWVRCGGRTIGSGSSGGTERANADCQDLFEYLWTASSGLSVSGGRGGSAAADWAANKTIALPDYRGRVLAGLDDMGASAAGRLTATYFGAAATTLNAAGGLERHQLTEAQIPVLEHDVDPHSHGGLTGRNFRMTAAGGSSEYQTTGGSATLSQAATTAETTVAVADHGGGGSHNNVQPTSLVTIYIKL